MYVCSSIISPHWLFPLGYSLFATPYTEASRWEGQIGVGHIRRLYKAPTDYTKPRQIIQSPDRLYQATKRLYKNIKC